MATDNRKMITTETIQSMIPCMIPVVLYARYSSNNQREESIDAQVRAIEEYAVRHGYTIVKHYNR